VSVLILDATEAHLEGILAIYNEVIANSTAVYSAEAVALAERQAWWRTRTAQGYPVLVALGDAGVLGFASFGDFRTWPGYRFTVEHSVHVRAEARGQGVGGALLAALLPRASACGKHMMVGGVDAANAASIRFHERLGFTRTALLREVGFKFDRWLDLLFLQRQVDAR
jgi:phosphinothricin acetyltransferase